MNRYYKYISRLIRRQSGAILPLAIMASLLGIAVVIPAAALVGTAALRQGDFEDKSREFYLIDSAILAVVSDLQRGADGYPLAPEDYIPPTVNFADSVPNIVIRSLEADLALAAAQAAKDSGLPFVPPSMTVSTTRMVTYLAGSVPVPSVGAAGQGTPGDLLEEDGEYYRVTAPADSNTFSYEITSDVIGFSDVQFGKVEISLRAWEESVDLRVFVFNPDDPDHVLGGYNSVPDAATLLDHHHILDDSLLDNHNHGKDHDEEPHTHDTVIDENDVDNLHFHGKGAQAHDHSDHHVRTTADSNHEFHLDAHDLHHGHHDDKDHEEDEGHGHHGNFGHDHHHNQSKETDHHHYLDGLGNDDHLSVENHPDDHPHHGHKGPGKHHHHGEETISFFLSAADKRYLDGLVSKVLTVKIVATVFDDPEHHHLINKHDDFDANGDKITGPVHDHIHHEQRLNPPLFSIETDLFSVALGGPATTDSRQPNGEPVITFGTLVSGSVGDLLFDDTSYLTIASQKLDNAIPVDDFNDSANDDDDEKKNFKHVVEYELESLGFVFSRMDTISVPLVVRMSESKKAKVRMFVFNTGGAGHDPTTGYSVVPDLVATVKAVGVQR